ncbi:hypothetical protein A3A14_00810 [Candidatus Daviesbacteria bacterium RIFCSPLOWO2_01_FULL_43_38]|uniref:Glycosyltransferase RgtA/B/C/D-like domain-containing protein n=3 Tax=Candidatus Daviesiibacteriota TaxID=1752718 RepID=A0A1F5K6T7_9BACT|nr:MAG: hypothetical protein UV41_C0002G0016 [Candidatus Daviesbacteria bacterium GW2011_GWA2_42_7]OGE36460.1 MAG: hypothetical protein A3E45_00890 [Candidatus Daviesbacteria bacterium RIFCSPHIGHO2_12_FULL_43_11]OGE63505.1 MAG: hypothetical protein A3A14_00810 [Candidatus Daviesbacteria bacterium RIFCSPLOWO2_01_FULL_43_38]
MSHWIKKYRTEIIFVCLILLFASFLRFYRLPEYMAFLGDEGRDALVIKEMLVEHNLPFIGPPTSVGNIYLGPLYYYMIAVPMAFFWLNPVAAAGMVAGIGVATVFLIYYLARQWFGVLPAAFSAILYAVSPVTIIYSRSSWNPNPAPFFALLTILGIYKAHKNKNYKWLTLSGAALAAAIQMHYLAMILIPVFLILWIIELKATKGERNNFFLGTVMSVFAFFLIMLPLILFDLKHNFLNFRAISTLFTESQGALGFGIFNSISKVFPIYIQNLVGRYLSAEILLISLILGILILFPFAMLKRKGVDIWPYKALAVWLLVGLLGLSFYKHDLYDHYLGFLSPVPFLLLGASLNLIKKRWRYIAVPILLLVIGVINFQRNPLLSPPNNQLTRTQEIAKYVIGQSEGKPFNFALIAKSNYDSAYRFYLDQYGARPEVLSEVITDQLFVVCEDPVCNPIGHPKYEIAAFGWAKIERESEVLGVKVYKLVSNPGGKPL